jgi:ribosomal protein S18 acetylase RimI-like enzyme
LTGEEPEPRYIVEPFDPDRHDRTAFSCGVPKVDNYFKKTANKLHQAGNVRLFVMIAPGGEVAGFYAINAHAVSFDDLPRKYARTRPAHGDIPAAYISMIGRDEKFRGSGYGADLLVDALTRIAAVADQLGLAVVMLDVLDCGDAARTARRKALYESYGFTALASNPLRMFLPIATVRAAIEERSGEGERGGDSGQMR